MKKSFLSVKLVTLILLVVCTCYQLNAQSIISSVQGGKAEEVKTLLAKGIDPNTRDGKMTILGQALYGYKVQMGNNNKPKLISAYLETSKALINAKGIKVNEWNVYLQPEVSWKYTALMDVVAYPELVNMLIAKGALLDLQDDWLEWNGKLHETGGNTALMLSVDKHSETAKILINKGANINLQNRMYVTALMLAVNNPEIAKILIDKGAKIDVQDIGGETALMKAAAKNAEVVKLLLDKGANMVLRQQAKFKSSQNALDYAASAGNLATAKLILEKAKTLGIKDEMIRVSLHWAVINNQLEMAKYLLDEGANVEGNDDLGAFTPLMETSNLEIVKLLIARGANVNAKNAMNYTPLHKAVFNYMGASPNEKDCDKILSLMLEKGANIDAQDKNGTTPLMSAVQKINPVKILMTKGAKVNLQNANGETALMLAVKGGVKKGFLGIPDVGSFTDAVKQIIAANADLNLQDKWGKTALMHASGASYAMGDSYGSYTDMTQLLLEKGAKLETLDKEGHTALYWAQRYNRSTTSQLLISKGANPAQKYDRKLDKSNVKAGIVGTWTNSMTVNVAVKRETITMVNKVVFGADWSYSKTQTMSGQTIPDGGGYNSYDIRDGKIWLLNKLGVPAVFEYRFEGTTLILNGEKYTKAVKK